MLNSEPKLEKIGGRMEINNDSNFGIRYANIVSILNCLEKYLSKSPEKDRFSPQTSDFKNLIIINDLLKNDKDQIIILAEILLLLSSISSKKEYYLDKMSELEDMRYVNAFFTHIEKYILLDSKMDETINNLNQSMFDKSYMVNVQYSKQKEEFERERESLIKTIKENERVIIKLNEKNENLEKTLSDMEMKYKDKEREFEIARNSQHFNLKVQEEMFKDNMVNSELVSQLNSKDAEISDLKREHELAIKKMLEEIKKIQEKCESYEDKIMEMKSLKVQNEKLNSKIKELTIIKEHKIDYEEMKRNLEAKNKQIETLLKEKGSYATQIEKINKELLHEKEKFRQADYERKKIEYDMNEMKRENSRMEYNSNAHIRHANQNNMYNILNNNLQMNVNNISNINEEKFFELGGVGGDSMIFDDFKELGVKNKNHFEKEYLELKNEKNELAKLYRAQIDEIHKLIDEKDRLLNTIDSFRLQIEKFNSEKERSEIEKEKLNLQIQKFDLDTQKLTIVIERYENEKRRLEEDLKEISDKAETLYNEKNLKVKECEGLKNLLANNQVLSDKLLTEKQSLIKEYQYLQNECEKYKIGEKNFNLNGSDMLNMAKNKRVRLYIYISLFNFINNIDFTKK
jgi:chromosome segregation ATPase